MCVCACVRVSYSVMNVIHSISHILKHTPEGHEEISMLEALGAPEEEREDRERGRMERNRTRETERQREERKRERGMEEAVKDERNRIKEDKITFTQPNHEHALLTLH